MCNLPFGIVKKPTGFVVSTICAQLNSAEHAALF